MKHRNFAASIFILILAGFISGSAHPGFHVSTPPAQVKSSDVEFMTAVELKAKVAKNQTVTIIDVRATEAFADSSRKIKGAIHVKMRRLRYRLGFEPLKSVSHDTDVVTYCACPNDELSIQAAQVLLDAGFKRVRVLKGGWREWLKLNGPVEVSSKGM
jgi:rhodanese-related sulfurtransferase